MADHDGNYHLLFSHPHFVAELLEDILAPSWLASCDLGSLKRLNFKLHDAAFKRARIKRREGDLLWQLSPRGGSASHYALLLELQSKVDRWMAVRLLIYTGHVYSQLIREKQLVGGRLPRIHPVVFYSGKGHWTAPTELHSLVQPEPEGVHDDRQPTLSYDVVDELRYPGWVLEQRGSALAALLALERCDDAERVDGLLARFVQRLSGPQHQEARRVAAAFLKRSAIAGLFPERVEDVQTLLEGGAHMLAEKVELWNQQLIEKGFEKGLERGIEKGIEKGIIEVLTVRFGPLPEPLSQQLSNVGELGTLQQLLTAAVTTGSLDAFQAELQRRGL